MSCPDCSVVPNINEPGDGHSCDVSPTESRSDGRITVTMGQAASAWARTGSRLSVVEERSWFTDTVCAVYLLLYTAEFVLTALYLTARVDYWQDPTTARLAHDDSLGRTIHNSSSLMTIVFWLFLLNIVLAGQQTLNALRRQSLTPRNGVAPGQVRLHRSSTAATAAFLAFLAAGFFEPHLAALDPSTAVAQLEHYRRSLLLAEGVRILALVVIVGLSVHRRLLVRRLQLLGPTY